jgi:hypothetical protein
MALRGTAPSAGADPRLTSEQARDDLQTRGLALPKPAVRHAWTLRRRIILVTLVLQRWPLGMPSVVIVDEVCELLGGPALGCNCRLVVDYTGVGRAVGELFTQAKRYGWLVRWPYLLTITGGFASGTADEDEESAVHKGDLVSVAQTATARRRLKLPPELPLADALQKEMRAFRVKQNPRTGNVGWEAERESDHHDLVIALALWGRHRYGDPRFVDEHGGLQEKPWAIAAHSA